MHEERERELVQFCAIFPKNEQDAIQKSIVYAKNAHKGQIRKSSGLPYIIHPLDVALEVAREYKDPVLTLAAVLHDVVEDNATIAMKTIYQEFGQDVGFIVDALTKGTKTFYGMEREFASYRDKFLYGGMQDVRVFLVKLADRKDNFQTLHAFREAKQLRISFETQALYSPLKMILECGSGKHTVESLKKHFAFFLSEKNIVHPRELESLLYSYSFVDLSHALFDEVYTCSEDVVWEIRDLERFEKLLQNTQFEECARLLACIYDGKEIRIRFKMTKPLVAEAQHATKIAITGFSHI